MKPVDNHLDLTLDHLLHDHYQFREAMSLDSETEGVRDALRKRVLVAAELGVYAYHKGDGLLSAAILYRDDGTAFPFKFLEVVRPEHQEIWDNSLSRLVALSALEGFGIAYALSPEMWAEPFYLVVDEVSNLLAEFNAHQIELYPHLAEF